jgi:hypothetical protein
MGMKDLCKGLANGGAVNAIPYHGHGTFDFNQITHTAYDLVGAGLAGAPTGCCLALTIAWLHYWHRYSQYRPARPDPNAPPNAPVPNLTYSYWVGVGGTDRNAVLQNTVGIFNPAHNWQARTIQILNAIIPQGGAAPHWQTSAAAGMPIQVGLSRYTILDYVGANGSHAMGVLCTVEHSGQHTIHFFDPNQGEARFATLYDFCNWYVMAYEPSVLVPAFGARASISWLAFS